MDLNKISEERQFNLIVFTLLAAIGGLAAYAFQSIHLERTLALAQRDEALDLMNQSMELNRQMFSELKTCDSKVRLLGRCQNRSIYRIDNPYIEAG